MEFGARNATMQGNVLSFELTLLKGTTVMQTVPISVDFTGIQPSQLLAVAKKAAVKALKNNPHMAAQLVAEILNRQT
ncbi:hypothetical protein CMI37_33230 [Candidatus Pacearchaeota archaeon]|nr:hypothetical protein [Candidatus Pacearchaeota archaeon]|tara:strand:+ start:2808 stop:3038 length:231 start_codon:yes stop_codon:yes gene_type:complete